MRLHHAIRRPLLAALLVTVTTALAACHVPLFQAEARDEWKRTWTLSAGGSVEIRNTNGEVRIEPGQGTTVDVVATRIARAGTDADARRALEELTIRETATGHRIALDSTRSGIEIGVSRRVDYLVRVPAGTSVNIRTTNGGIHAAGVDGALRAETTNGTIRATGIVGAVHAETTNGGIELTLAAVSRDGVTCETTNGTIDLTVPPDAKATVEARTTNGGIEAVGAAVTVTDKARRKLDASMGGGGPLIRLQTTNGGIHIRG